MKLVLFLILTALPAKADELFEVHTNARALGMGGAFSSVVDNEESLWYNPAGIAKNGGFFWTIADPKIGLSNPTTALESFSNLGDSSTFASALDGLYGEPIWIGASGKTALIMPFFAAAYFYDVDASIIVDNPVSPTLTTNYITDTGFALGSGWSIAGVLQMGFAVKYISRSGVRKDWGSQTIADIVSGTGSPDTIFDSFTTVKGTGYALDYGMNLTIPTIVQPTLSFVWKNMGNTNFRVPAGEEAPPTEPQDMQLGASLLVDLPLIHVVPALEIRHLNDSEVQLAKKLHMGVEVGLPLLDLRAGLYQGYYTFGAGLDLGFLQLDAATWGTELGGYPGQFEGRRYMVQATLRIGFDFGFGSSVSSGGKGASGTGASRFGGKKLKQRR